MAIMVDVRLGRYCTLLGRRSALWHGDVATGRKKGDRVSAEAADVRDWLYEEADGTVTGAFTEKAIKQMQSRPGK